MRVGGKYWGGVFVALCAHPVASHAQVIDTYLPSAVPGFDEQQGVAVLTEPRPQYEAEGVRTGGFIVQTGIDESLGYNSNLLGTENALGSAFVETAPYVDVASDWGRDRIGLHASLDSIVDTDAPSQTHTDGSVGLGGSMTIGRGDASLGYTHLWQHENGTDIGAIASETPIGYDVDDVRGEVTIVTGSMAWTPNFDVADYRFGDATLGGAPVGESYQDRLIAALGVTGRYEAAGNDWLLILQGLDSHYTDPAQDQPSLDSRSGVALAGIDTPADQIWRVRLLAGVEYRSFAAEGVAARTEPVVEARVVWSPSRMLTLTATATRSVEDPQTLGIYGYVFSNARFTADYEWRRNVLLQGRLGFAAAEFLPGGGTQTVASAGAGITWLINRTVHISLNYDFADQHAPLNGDGALPLGPGGVPFGPVRLTGGNYTQSVVVVRAHVAL